MRNLRSIMDQVAGLNPTALLCVGGGYVREEVKSLFFQHGKSISGNAILNPRGLCQLLAKKNQPILGEGTGVELLRALFKEPNVRAVFPLLSEQRFRPRFYEKCFSSLQQGRRFFAHAAEADVMRARLEEVLGLNEKRNEFFLLNQFWEKILEDRDLYDDARLLEVATAALSYQSEFPFQTVYQLEHFALPPRAHYFWSELSKRITVEPISSVPELKDDISIESVATHSLEDAAFFMFDEIANAIMDPNNKMEHAIVIQDLPAIRRTVMRTAKIYGIPFYDPRDPMALNLSEEIKSTLLEFEIVAKNFSAPLVCQWIAHQPKLRAEAGKIRIEIQERGIQNGIQSYQGEKLSTVMKLMKELESKWPKRIKLQEIRARFLSAKSMQGFWERFFDEWIQDLELIGAQEARKPLRLWLEQLKEKLRTARPPSDSVRVKGGLPLYRVDQAPSFRLNQRQKLHFFGIDSSFFEAKDWTNDWFTQREVDVLSREFGLPSREMLMTEREQSFLKWASASAGAPARLWIYDYDEAGTECDSLHLNLLDLASLSITELGHRGAHPRLASSWSSDLKLGTDRLMIPEAMRPEKNYSMSFLDDYSECPFTAYAAHMMRAQDEREPDYDLMGDSFGQLIHVALEKLIRNQLSPQEAFERAWAITPKKGWIKSERIQFSIRHRAVRLLEEFAKQEAEYRERSGATPMAMEEDLKLELKREGFTFSGRADRIDQHDEGLVVFDYKTQSKLTSGRKILEKGQSLQLALYGLALKDRYAQEVVGAHFIQLTSKDVKRNNGLIFKKWNGKKTPKALTTASGNSHSILDLEPEAAWEQLNQQVLKKLAQLKTADFSPRAVDPEDCKKCRYRLTCGWLRRNRTGELLNAEEGLE